MRSLNWAVVWLPGLKSETWGPRQLEPISHGEFDAVLKNGSRTRVSRTYRAQLEKRLGQTL
jgi:hypothetical protein